MLAAAAAAFARPPMGPGMDPHRFPIEHTYLRAELDSLFGTEGELGALSYGELRELAGRLSVALQKDRFVARSKAMSFMMPGSGQFLNKDYGSGAAFLATDLAVVAGTLIGAYYLLPDDLRFQQLDYFNTSFARSATPGKATPSWTTCPPWPCWPAAGWSRRSWASFPPRTRENWPGGTSTREKSASSRTCCSCPTGG